MEETEYSAFIFFAQWLQNFFGVSVPVVGAMLGGWVGFFIGTGVSLVIFLIVNTILGGTYD